MTKVKPRSAEALDGGRAGEQHAATHVTISLAQNTEIINGKKGKGNFKPTSTGSHDDISVPIPLGPAS